MNKVMLLGRITRDPEIRYSNGENANANCRFSVAVNRKFKNAEGQYDADFINCVAFGKTAEFVGKFFKKGDPICLDGNIRTGSYTNKEGVKVYTTDVFVDSAEFVPAKKGETGSGSRPDPSSFMNVGDDELPFN